MRRYLCLSVDVEGYGTHSDVRQAEIQSDLLDLLDRAAGRADLDRRRWIRQPTGDGELALLADDQPSSRVVGDFCLGLAAALGRHNSARRHDARIRLRLAFDEGPIDVSANGFAGRAVVGVSRLVNAQPLRALLAATDQADLAVIVSDGVFRDWIGSGRSTVRAEWGRRVEVREKEYVADAWLWLPGRMSRLCPWIIEAGRSCVACDRSSIADLNTRLPSQRFNSLSAPGGLSRLTARNAHDLRNRRSLPRCTD